MTYENKDRVQGLWIELEWQLKTREMHKRQDCYGPSDINDKVNSALLMLLSTPNFYKEKKRMRSWPTTKSHTWARRFLKLVNDAPDDVGCTTPPDATPTQRVQIWLRTLGVEPKQRKEFDYFNCTPTEREYQNARWSELEFQLQKREKAKAEFRALFPEKCRDFNNRVNDVLLTMWPFQISDLGKERIKSMDQWPDTGSHRWAKQFITAAVEHACKHDCVVIPGTTPTKKLLVIRSMIGLDPVSVNRIHCNCSEGRNIVEGDW